MYEPHLTGFDQDRSDGPSVFTNGSSLLDELDRVAPIQRFDAFPKVGPVISSNVTTVLIPPGSVDVYKPVSSRWSLDGCRVDCDLLVGIGEWAIPTATKDDFADSAERSGRILIRSARLLVHCGPDHRKRPAAQCRPDGGHALPL